MMLKYVKRFHKFQTTSCDASTPSLVLRLIMKTQPIVRMTIMTQECKLIVSRVSLIVKNCNESLADVILSSYRS